MNFGKRPQGLFPDASLVRNIKRRCHSWHILSMGRRLLNNH